MRFYYFDFSLLDPTQLLKNLGKSFSGGWPGGGGCVGDRGGRKEFFWELGEVWSGARCGEGRVRMGEPSKGSGGGGQGQAPGGQLRSKGPG